jgi:hypothetical protein
MMLGHGFAICAIGGGGVVSTRGLCHEAPIRPVAQPNRSSATRPIDIYLGGFLLHWLSVPFRGTLHYSGYLGITGAPSAAIEVA